MWTLQHNGGRVFTTALGHDMPSINSPLFIATFVRGVEWAATGNVTIPPPALSSKGE
jgi:type 1 glutamine amidotransferase